MSWGGGADAFFGRLQPGNLFSLKIQPFPSSPFIQVRMPGSRFALQGFRGLGRARGL